MKLWPIPACFAAGAVLARTVLHAAAPRFPVDLAQPLVVATNWGAAGALVWSITAATIAGAAFFYWNALQGAAPRAWALFAASGAAMLAGLFWLPLLSSDVYAYAAYGEMARLGLDPYVHHALGGDAIVAAARWQWSGTLPICVYGEAFVALARAIVTALHGLGIAAVLDGFRLLSMAALLACGFAALHLRDERSAAFIALNPLALYEAIEGHNDTVMLAIVLAGFVLMRRSPLLGTALAALGATVKAPALAASWAVAWERRSGAQLAGALLGTVVVAAASLRLLLGVRTTLAPHAHYAPYASVQSLAPVLAAALALAVLARARSVAEPVDRWTLVALAAWLAIPNPYPWYALWLIALAAFVTDRRIVVAVLAVSAASLLRYLPDAAGVPAPALALGLGIAALLAYTPLARGSRA